MWLPAVLILLGLANAGCGVWNWRSADPGKCRKAPVWFTGAIIAVGTGLLLAR